MLSQPPSKRHSPLAVTPQRSDESETPRADPVPDELGRRCLAEKLVAGLPRPPRDLVFTACPCFLSMPAGMLLP